MANVILFLQSHEAVLSSLAVAVLDLAFALSPSLNANGILHMIYQFATKNKGPVLPSGSDQTK